ncbi:Putative conjugal transfer protein [bacterium HR25]|jgi:pilus assembly protein CpaF|nr:Putative conjugal transfer protein [bacterium HR25]
MNQWQRPFFFKPTSGFMGGGDSIAARSASGELSHQGIIDLVFRIHQRLIRELDPAQIEKLDAEQARYAVEAAARAVLAEEAPSVAGELRDEVVSAVANEVLGYGPIDPLVRDPSVSEVMVNAPDRVYFERDGIIHLSTVRFRDHEHIMRIAERIVAPLGRRVDESSPMVDARLPDGSRVNIIIPPVAPDSPIITIRKFRQDKLTMEDLIRGGTLPEEWATFLEGCVKARLNILISGGTGTGKTTFLNALSAFIPERERIITIEDPVELKLQQAHVIRLEARPPNLEGKNEVTQRDLFRNALRMRPDRIIVGEVRGAEAFDMLQAMNTGHEGSLTTIHANSPRDALARVENMVLMAGFDLPVQAIREQIASALHVVVQMARLSDGRRRIVSISEITGMEGRTVTMQELFRFEQRGVSSDGMVMGDFVSTGIRPRFADRFEVMGIYVPTELFVGERW